MAGAPERRYTDSDVRADPTLTEMAYDYLDGYTGEFEPLVRAQEKVAARQYLTTAQVRVVLNCMRNDWDIADQMPAPMAKVIDMPVRDGSSDVARKPKKKKGKVPNFTDRYVPCGDTSFHAPHAYEANGFDQWRCDGVYNNRPDHLWVDAKIKTPYVKAPGGKMIHLLGEGSNFHWYPNRYGDGYGSGLGPQASFNSQWGRFPPDLNVKVLCKYPSWLRNPLLLWEIPEGLITNDGTPITLCKYCEAERDG